MERRIDKSSGFGQSSINGRSVNFELAERIQAIGCGGIGMMLPLIKQVKLRENINDSITLFKLHAPYSEADHVLNISLNLLAGGTCLDHLEQRRTDEAYLEALGAQRIPDPTTAGDFCRRFGPVDILRLQQAINDSRQIVWKQQPESFFDEATIDVDGTTVETQGEKKQGIGINYKGQWGYHPLVVSLAQTREVLYLANRPGNRPSHEHAHFYLDLAAAQCQKAGFRKITFRGDTDFSQTQYLDGWDAKGIEFVFGFDAVPSLVAMAENIDKSQWKRLKRQKRQAAEPRAQRANVRQKIVVEKGYKNLQLVNETYTEVDYQPGSCGRSYRLVVVRKEIECSRGQQRLFDDDETRYFFYITNKPASECAGREVIRSANQRCNQENTISQLKASHCLSAPLGDLNSNWAYMVIASLAWSLKQWSALLVRVKGNPNQRKKRGRIHQWILKMEFATFLNSLIMIPAQVIRGARKTTFRVLTNRPTVETLLTVHDHISLPLRT